MWKCKPFFICNCMYYVTFLRFMNVDFPRQESVLFIEIFSYLSHNSAVYFWFLIVVNLSISQRFLGQMVVFILLKRYCIDAKQTASSPFLALAFLRIRGATSSTCPSPRRYRDIRHFISAVAPSHCCEAAHVSASRVNWRRPSVHCSVLFCNGPGGGCAHTHGDGSGPWGRRRAAHTDGGPGPAPH